MSAGISATVGAPRAWEAYRAEFPIFREVTYLNSCSLGALSERVAASVQECLALWNRYGAAAWYGPWWETIAVVRGQIAAILGAEPEEIALFPNVTGALSAVASALDHASRPRVIMSRMEFPTTRYQWMTRQGVETTFVGSPDGVTVPLEFYADAADDRTSLVVGSHVYFTSGMIQDIAALARLSHAQGAYCLIDAYQSVGQLPLDVHASGVDFLVGGGLKWLLGGTGIAFLYIKRALATTLESHGVGWFAHAEQFRFAPEFVYAPDARRFEGGTPSILAMYAMRAGLEIVREIGVERLRARQLELTGDLVARAREAGLRPRVPDELTGHAGIVTIPREDPGAVVRGLAERDIIVDFRPGVVRVSPYFYNQPEDHQRAVDALLAVARRGVA